MNHIETKKLSKTSDEAAHHSDAQLVEEYNEQTARIADAARLTHLRADSLSILREFGAYYQDFGGHGQDRLKSISGELGATAERLDQLAGVSQGNPEEPIHSGKPRN